MPEPLKKERLIQDSAARGTPSCSKEKKDQEPYYYDTGQKAQRGSRKPSGYHDETSSPRGNSCVL
jgi:hypothetical protein